MYDISNLGVGEQFYYVPCGEEIFKCKIIPKKNIHNDVGIIKIPIWSKKQTDIRRDWMDRVCKKEYFRTRREAEEYYRKRLHKKVKSLDNIEILLNDLYEYAFEDSCICLTFLYRQAIIKYIDGLK